MTDSIEKTKISREDLDRAMFQRVQNLLVGKRAFLIPGLTRDQVIGSTSVPKNKFAYLFRHFVGMSYKDYINDLRLIHAAELLERHPEYTIETVAKDSGIQKPQTFYRLFHQKFKMTPSAYRMEKRRN